MTKDASTELSSKQEIRKQIAVSVYKSIHAYATEYRSGDSPTEIQKRAVSMIIDPEIENILQFHDAYLQAAVAEAKINLAQEYVQAGRVATLIGKYPTGENRYSYDIDNAKIGEYVRKSFLSLATEEQQIKQESSDCTCPKPLPVVRESWLSPHQSNCPVFKANNRKRKGQVMQVKDIGDEIIYDAIRKKDAWNNSHPSDIKWPYDFIDAPEKVVLRKMGKMVDQGKLDYGVSLRSAWIEKNSDE